MDRKRKRKSKVSKSATCPLSLFIGAFIFYVNCIFGNYFVVCYKIPYSSYLLLVFSPAIFFLPYRQPNLPLIILSSSSRLLFSPSLFSFLSSLPLFPDSSHHLHKLVPHNLPSVILCLCHQTTWINYV